MALCRYLHDGITWTRLKSLATQPTSVGGLSLFSEISRECVDIFSKAPPNIIDARPETDMLFLNWLGPREEVLSKCIMRDSEQRTLSDMELVLKTLGDQQARMERMCLAELLFRGLYLHRFAMKYGHIMNPEANTTPPKLIETAATLICSASCTNEFCQSLGFTLEDVIARDQIHQPWCKLLTAHFGLEDLDLSVSQFHLKVSIRMAAHLKLTLENISQPHWWAASLLSTSAVDAQEAACSLHDFIKRKQDTELNGFERSLRLDEDLWCELGNFIEHRPPCILWRGQGAYKNLFNFIACRFAGNPDSCLGAEGIHSMWQAILRMRCSVKHPLLNAILKTRFALSRNDMPSVDDLLPHFCRCRQTYYEEYCEVAAAGEVAPRLRVQQLHMDRFNVSAHDVQLLKGPVRDGGNSDAGPEVRWANYCRSVMKPMNFYAFQDLTANLFFCW